MGVTGCKVYGMKITRRTRMVNDVPMETIYKGMSLERLGKVQELLRQAADNVYDKHECRFAIPRWKQGSEQFAGAIQAHAAECQNLVDIEFRRLCDRAASKAGWHANKRNNRKKEAVK